jgi:hypothetical protein
MGYVTDCIWISRLGFCGIRKGKEQSNVATGVYGNQGVSMAQVLILCALHFWRVLLRVFVACSLGLDAWSVLFALFLICSCLFRFTNRCINDCDKWTFGWVCMSEAMMEETRCGMLGSDDIGPLMHDVWSSAFNTAEVFAFFYRLNLVLTFSSPAFHSHSCPLAR